MSQENQPFQIWNTRRKNLWVFRFSSQTRVGSLGLRIKDFSDSSDFINKSKSINAIFKEVLLVSADVVDL